MASRKAVTSTAVAEMEEESTGSEGEGIKALASVAIPPVATQPSPSASKRPIDSPKPSRLDVNAATSGRKDRKGRRKGASSSRSTDATSATSSSSPPSSSLVKSEEPEPQVRDKKISSASVAAGVIDRKPSPSPLHQQVSADDSKHDSHDDSSTSEQSTSTSSHKHKQQQQKALKKALSQQAETASAAGQAGTPSDSTSDSPSEPDPASSLAPSHVPALALAVDPSSSSSSSSTTTTAAAVSEKTTSPPPSVQPQASDLSHSNSPLASPRSEAAPNTSATAAVAAEDGASSKKKRTSKQQHKKSSGASKGQSPTPPSGVSLRAGETVAGANGIVPDMETFQKLETKLIERARKLKQAKEVIIQTKNQFNQHVYSIEKQLDQRERSLVISQQEINQQKHRLCEWEEQLKARQATVEAQEKAIASAPPPAKPAAASAVRTSSDSLKEVVQWKLAKKRSSLQPAEGSEAAPSAVPSSSTPATPARPPAVVLHQAGPRGERAAVASATWLAPCDSEDVLVIDNGTFMLRAGLASSGALAEAAAPRQLRNRTANIVERIDEDALLSSYVKGSESSKPFFEKKQEARRKAVGLIYSVQDTSLVNLENAETIYGHLFELLGTKASAQPLMLTTSDFVTVSELQKSTEWFFETMGAADLGYVPQSLASLYSAGLHTGISVDLGYSSTRVVACYGGSVLSKRKIPLGWQHLHDAVQASLIRHHASAEALPGTFVDELTQKALYVAASFEQELKDFQAHGIEPSMYPVPQCDPVNLTLERFRIAESYFRPSHLGIQSSGLHHVIRSLGTSLFSERAKFQSEMNDVCSNILLSGGGSQIPGLWPRLKSELAPDPTQPASSTTLQPYFGLLSPVTGSEMNTWVGAANYARSQGGRNRITKQIYDEFGPTYLERTFW